VIAGIAAVGTAILDAAGSPIAVVVVVAPAMPSPSSSATALRDAVAELNELLGYQPASRPDTSMPH
jgi:hypothetical protein